MINLEHNIKLIPYFEKYNDSASGLIFTLLRVTGRWKLERGPGYELEMFVEHKGFLFRHWISERYISFRPMKHSVVFDCWETNI